ncbi:MAG TPA: hypothetical protein PKH77_05135 [Anaerolineae bacterium]|nr:hypothetical protein [Anaerolineae bacterium]
MGAEVLADLRRERVASLLLRGLTPLEITVQLKRQGLKDPETGEAYLLAVIVADVAALDAEWQAQANDPDAQRARVLAELREVRRAAWAKNDMGGVLRGLQQEAALLDRSMPPSRAYAFTPISTTERDLLLPVDG